MKKIKKNILLLIIICILVLYFVLRKDFNGIVDLIVNSNKLYVLIAISLVLLSDIFKGWSISKLINSSGYSYSIKNGFLLMIMTNFFNGITPFSLGGQPFELYMLKKNNNIDYITGTNILFKDFYTYQIALVMLSFTSILIIYLSNFLVLNSIATKMLWIGFLINLAIMLFLIYIPYSKKDKFKIVDAIVSFLDKFKIIKSKEKIVEKINSSIIKFKKQTKETIRNPKLIFKCVFLNCLKIAMVCLSTYFCFISIGSSIPMFKSIVITILITIMASYIPIPGASGGMEFSFILMFSYFVIDSKLGAAMLMWRFVTYYLPLIYGSIIFLIKRK